MSKREITVEKFKSKFADVVRHTRLEVVDIVIALEKMDPTKNLQYVPWLAKQLINEQFKFEDTKRVKTILEHFETLKPRLAKRDINQFSFYELDETIEQVLNPKIGIKEAKKQQGTFPVVTNSDVLYNGPFGQLAIPRTAQAAKELGSGTKWCTTDAGPFKQYNREGPLYVWRDRSGDKFQFHITTDPPSKVRLVDAQDRYVKAPEAKQFKEHPVIGQIIKEQDKIYRQYLVDEKKSHEEKHKIQQERSKAQRQIQREHDRIHDLHKFILDEYGINVKHIKKANTYPGGLEGFCKDVLDEQWDKIKPQMALGPRSSLEFAILVIKGRWIEQEPLIANHAVSWTMYSREILGTNNMTKEGRTARDKMRREVLKTVGLKLTAKMKKLPQW
jgi:hypothetical protein